MTTCLLHPQTEAAGGCEYCAQPHCASCLQPLLGRRYCPPCRERVRALAGGAPLGTAAAGPLTAAAVGGVVPEASRPRLPGWASALLYLVGFMILTVVGQTALALSLFAGKFMTGRLGPGQPVTEATMMDASGIGLPLWSFIFAFFGWAILLVIVAFTVLMVRGVERRTLADIGLAWRRTFWRDLVAGLALSALFFVSVVGIGAGHFWYAPNAAASLPNAVVIILVGFLILLPYAAVEEISTRGYLILAGSRSWGRAGGVVAGTVAFALLHSMNPGMWDQPLALVGLLLAGLYLASAYLITGNLWLAIFLHTGWNLMEGPVFGLPVSGMALPASVFRTSVSGPDLWTGGKFGPEAGLLLCLLMAVHIAALWALRPLFRPRPGDAPPARPTTSATGEPIAYRAIPLG